MANKPRKTFLKFLSHGTLTPLEELRQLLHLSALPDKEPFRSAIDYLRQEVIATLHPLNLRNNDLTDFEQAIIFCLENKNNKKFKAEIALLHACTKALEADSIDALHINLIVATFIDLALKNERSRKSSNGGCKDKKLPGVMAAVRKILKDQPTLSAEKIWRYFEDNHHGSINALKINNFRVYFTDTEKGEYKEKLHQASPGTLPKSITRSAFAGYVKEAKKNQNNFTSK